MDPDRASGSLIAAGGILGLAGTVSTFFPFSVLGVISFALVLSFGVLVYRKRPEGRLLAAAVLWFAVLGGVASVLLLWLAPMFVSDRWVLQGSLGLLGTGVALTGAGIKQRALRS